MADVTTARAEAAAWLARLRSEERTAGDEAGFRAWLAESEAHRQAFDTLNTVWEAAGALPRQPRRAKVADRRMVLASGLAAVVGLGSVATWKTAFAGTYATDIGEQRRVALDDGSLIILDTDSKVRVDFERRRRRVQLIRGRAHFEVARDSARPFTVEAADKQVVALGTAFEVSKKGEEVCVVVTKGEVAVFDPKRSAKQLAARGERVTLGETAPRLDRPDLARATAWQQGRAVFENDTLLAAALEMNRYSRRPIVIVGEEAAGMTVSGVYSTGDTEAFAQSLATLLPLDVRMSPEQVTITAENNS